SISHNFLALPFWFISLSLNKALGWGSGDLEPGAGQLAAGETAGANR
ncbi:hypothetical protein NF546_22525, partial [Pseudomonas aeruginosa]